MSRKRRILTADQKKSALVQIDRISAALKSLAMDVLNKNARIQDVDHALRLAASVERLRDKIWKYPVTRDLPSAKPPQRRARIIDRN